MSPDLAVTQYLPLAQKLAMRFYASKAGRRLGDADDCLQVALIGLYKAALAFDPARHLKFITLAWTCIIRQLCQEANIKNARIYEHFKHPARYVFDRLQGRERDPADVFADFSVLDALDSLDDPDRLIVRLRFVEGETQKEVARRLGLDWWVVAKIERRGLDQLRSMLVA